MFKKLISILMTFIFAMSFMTGCNAAEQKTPEQKTSEKFVLTMQIGNPVMTVNGEEKNIDENAFFIVTDAKNVFGRGFGDISDQN